MSSINIKINSMIQIVPNNNDEIINKITNAYYIRGSNFQIHIWKYMGLSGEIALFLALFSVLAGDSIEC
jgi:hypothetical protein